MGRGVKEPFLCYGDSYLPAGSESRVLIPICRISDHSKGRTAYGVDSGAVTDNDYFTVFLKRNCPGLIHNALELANRLPELAEGRIRGAVGKVPSNCKAGAEPTKSLRRWRTVLS